MDLTKFSTDDLVALQAGDLSRVSTPGLQILKRQQGIEKLKRENPAEYDPDSAEWKAKNDPTQGMSGTQKFLAGVGQGMTNIVRGAGQLVGVNSQEDIDEAKRLDAPLLNTGAGRAGSIAGNVAVALPTMLIPGAQGLVGATAAGAGLGFLDPVATGESRLKNAALGAAGGAAGVGAARVLAAGAQGVKALAEPFTAGGRSKIAGRTLQRFGVEAGDVAGLTNAPTITGAQTTLAEQITRPEGAAAAARLQDALGSAEPQVAAKLATRGVENNAARVKTLTELAGEGGQREFFDASRDAAAKELYGKAFAAKMDPALLTPADKAQMTILMRSPDVKAAVKEAQNNLLNRGGNVKTASGSIEGLHETKLALDEMIAKARTDSGASSSARARALESAQSRLVTFIEKMAPDYAEARATYAGMSKPLNQMDIADTLFRKGTANTGDLAGTPRLMPDKYVGQLKNEEALVKSATGRDLGKLSQVLEPDQFQKVIGVGQELDRAAAVARTGAGPGSPTAQRLASNNVLRQTLGPTGLPQSWSESTLLNTFMRPVQFAYNNVAEPKIQMTLAELILDPSKAAAAMKAATPAARIELSQLIKDPKLLAAARAAIAAGEQGARLTAPAASVGGN